MELLKLYYQLILHRCIRLMDPGDKLVIFPDKKNTTIDYNALRSSLNATIRRKYHRQRNLVVSATEVCSKKTQLGQVNDILLGAVGFHVNGRHLLATSAAPKIRLASDITRHARLPDLAQDVHSTRLDFGIWRFVYKDERNK